MSRPNIGDVARTAGVSAATVSRVMNGTTRVNRDKAQRVWAAVRTLGYRSSPAAHSLSARATDLTVGVLVPQLEDEFAGRVVTSIERELRENGVHMLCSVTHYHPREESHALRVFLKRRVDGLILLAPNLPDTALLEIADASIPMVLINRYLVDLAPHCIVLDNRRGGYLATRYVLKLGHHRIAHITGPQARYDARGRLDGYTDALHEAGIAYHEGLVIEGEYSVDSGHAATRRLLQRSDFSAIFAANDLQACGAIQALREASIAVPQRVSVIGFDDRSVATIAHPALTTMRYPMTEMGQQATEHLIATMQRRDPKALTTLEPTLVVRQSTAPVGPPPD